MLDCFYSIKMFINRFPREINCKCLLKMMDTICDILGCNCDFLGYSLLHPDYDDKDIGKIVKNNRDGRNAFRDFSIPSLYYGTKETIPSAPIVMFGMNSKQNFSFPDFDLKICYPICESQYLCIQIDVNEKILTKEISLETFAKLHENIVNEGFEINTAFIHYYSGYTGRMILNGIEYGHLTINDWRILDHAIRYQLSWYNKLLDVFYMNSYNRHMISEVKANSIRDLVGEENWIERGNQVYFKLTCSKEKYLLGRFVTLSERKNIKKMFQGEDVCVKDASLVASILKI